MTEQWLFSTLESVIDCAGGGMAADLALFSPEEMQTLNHEARGVDAPTDVLSFPSLSLSAGVLPSLADYPHSIIDGKLFIGDIALCPDIIDANAREYGHSKEREYAYMLCHSVLHLLGYDHLTKADKAAMRQEEERILSKLGYAQ